MLVCLLLHFVCSFVCSFVATLCLFVCCYFCPPADMGAPLPKRGAARREIHRLLLFVLCFRQRKRWRSKKIKKNKKITARAEFNAPKQSYKVTETILSFENLVTNSPAGYEAVERCGRSGRLEVVEQIPCHRTVMLQDALLVLGTKHLKRLWLAKTQHKLKCNQIKLAKKKNINTQKKKIIRL